MALYILSIQNQLTVYLPMPWPEWRIKMERNQLVNIDLLLLLFPTYSLGGILEDASFIFFVSDTSYTGGMRLSSESNTQCRFQHSWMHLSYDEWHMTTANTFFLDFHTIKFKMTSVHRFCFSHPRLGLIITTYRPWAAVNKVPSNFLLTPFTKAPSSDFHCGPVGIMLRALGLEKLPVKTLTITYFY